MINVLVVESSVAAREALAALLCSDPGLRVVGNLSEGEAAINAVRRLRPDLVLIGTHMLGASAVTRQIMETVPTPIVVVSDHLREEAIGFDAMEAGALAVVHRPDSGAGEAHERHRRELLQTVRLMAEVKVVRRWPRVARERTLAPLPAAEPALPPGRVRIVALGASTGGPPVLQTIFSALPKAYPLPVVVVQHMAPSFSAGFAEWLAQSCALPVRLPEAGERLQPGHIYLAPDGVQMKLGRRGQILLVREARENGLCPSVSFLFRSVAEVYGGDVAAGLLTGMGCDGAQELRLLRERGALTFVQDKASSVVHGMPGEAIRLGAASLVLPPEKIAALLVSLAPADDAREAKP